MPLNKIKELATGFEGCEKKIELDYFLTTPTSTLRNIPRTTLDSILEEAKCTIISTTKNEYFDSYVLSESSLFVFSSKIILKTCGTTSLLNCLVKLISASRAVGCEPDFLQFSRSNFMFPQNQPYPHRSFAMETQYLQALFPGQAYILGPINGPRWHLYISDFNCVHSDQYQQQTMEIIMFDLDPDVMRYFYNQKCIQENADGKRTKHQEMVLQHGTSSGEEATIKVGIDKLLPGSTIDGHLFSPCGYSCNGLLKDAYFTIHITPEPECSFVSFETNVVLSNYTSLVSQVLSTFRPGSFCLSLFVDEKATLSDARSGVSWDFEGYSTKGTTHHVFEGGYNAACGQYHRIRTQDNTVYGSVAWKNENVSSEQKHDDVEMDHEQVNEKLHVSYNTAQFLSHQQMQKLAIEAVRAEEQVEDDSDASNPKPPIASPHFGPSQPSMVLHDLPPSVIATDVASHIRRLASHVICTHQPEEAFFLVDIGEVVRRFYHWTRTFKRIQPVYAVNGNSGADGILIAVDALGGLFSCMSSTSLHTMLRLGIRSESLLFTSPWKPQSDLIMARSRGVDIICVETEKQLQKISIHHKQAKLIVQIAPPMHQTGEYHHALASSSLDERVLVGAGAGAGILLSSLPSLLTCAQSLGLSVIGIRYNIRTTCDDVAFHIRALENARAAFDMGAQAGYTFTTLDIGGGFPIDSSQLTSDVRHTTSTSQHFESIAATLVQHVDRLFPASVRVLASATEFLSVSSHTLVVNVVGKRARTTSTSTSTSTSTRRTLHVATSSTSTPLSICAPTKKRRVSNGDESTDGWSYIVNDGILASYDTSKTSVFIPVPLTTKPNATLHPSHVSGITSAGVAPLVTAQLPDLNVGDWLVFPNIPQPASLGIGLLSAPSVRYVHT